MRALRVAVVLLIATTVGSVAPAEAGVADGAGIAAADVLTSYTRDGGGVTVARVDYPSIKLFGTVTVGGATYTGGFWVTGISWSYDVYGWCPVAPPMGPCSGFPGVSQPDVGAPVPEGGTLSGADDVGGQRIGGYCGGSGSTAELIGPTTHVLHLGCGIAVDGHPGGWVWFDIDMSGAPEIVTGAYTASS
jgi:hypothetical protein